MDCARCRELETLYSDRTEEFVTLVERQSRLFRDGEAAAGRELDDAVREARSARDGALIELTKHVDSHDHPVASA